MKIKLFIGGLFLFATMNAQFTLDQNFGIGGKVTTPFGAGTAIDIIYALAVQPDGKIIAAGESIIGDNGFFALARFTADGVLDSTFGDNGKILLPYGGEHHGANCMLLQTDGKIVIGGKQENNSSTDFAIFRCNPDGSPDNTFGVNGLVVTDFGGDDGVSDIKLLPDGKIFAAGIGDRDFALARYNVDGTLDTTFGENGTIKINFGMNNAADYSNDSASNLSILPDGKLLLAGTTDMENIPEAWHFGIVKLNADGTPDAGFGVNGIVTTDFGSIELGERISIRPNGNILVSGVYYYNGFNNSKIALAEYLPDGSLNPAFGIDGKVISDCGTNYSIIFFRDAELQNDGKLLVTAVAQPQSGERGFFTTRYLPDGALDTDFGTAGVLTTVFEDMAASIAVKTVGSDIYVAGAASVSENVDFALVRYKEMPLGSNDLTGADFKVYPNPFTNYINVKFNLSITENLSVDLYDITGKKICFLNSGIFHTGENSLNLKFPESLANGLYLLNISNGKASSVVKVIK
ncbi:hypothetical protein HYN48_07950 [Flavobacterium magnum]|uniref:Secretion system C-terminal sorting domain-containing protein n=1 Tax=Flavobacterium magnum TaxID=2162713 RepID=A0A2S0REG7_9FLAO|nr:T9SS type A sorting domain-containing protein [Flavobacterium magnum]AWA30015.1 hypothetical protein HYN48_07950 [Flavobacterium magnum]